MNQASESLRPHWVIVGVPWADGKVAVLASDTLTVAELCVERDRRIDDDWEQWGEGAGRPTFTAIRGYTLTLQMPTFRIVVADTYQEALRQLLADWSPTAPSVTTPAVQAISAGQI